MTILFNTLLTLTIILLILKLIFSFTYFQKINSLEKSEIDESKYTIVQPILSGDPRLEEDLDTINVNFISPLILTKKFSEKFLQNGQGIILNVCSTAALYQHPYMAVYSSTKSALLHYSLALDEELSHKNKNVRILSVCPGPTASNFFDKDIQEKFGSSQKFMMSSEDVAKRIIKIIEKKKRFSIIGFRNRLSMFLINLLPVSLQLKLVGLFLKKVIK